MIQGTFWYILLSVHAQWFLWELRTEMVRSKDIHIQHFNRCYQTAQLKA